MTDTTKMATFTGIVRIEYHLQEQLVHPKASITMEDNAHAPDTPEPDVMTEEAIADLILGLAQETEMQVAQDILVQTGMPAGTETPDEGTHLTTTEFKADHLTGNARAAIDHQLPTLEIVLEADHPHAAMRHHPDAV